MGNEIADEELMLKYREGDIRAFEQLYVRHKGGLYRYFLRKCRNPATAEELFQDVWMKLIKARDRYEVKAKFTTWLYQLAHNHFIDHYRRLPKSGFNGSYTEDELENVPAGSGDQPEQQAEMQEQANSLLALIDTLPEEQKEVFLLKEEAGMSLAEIAQVTGVHVEAAKSRLRYAVVKLRKGLSADD